MKTGGCKYEDVKAKKKKKKKKNLLLGEYCMLNWSLYLLLFQQLCRNQPQTLAVS